MSYLRHVCFEFEMRE